MVITVCDEHGNNVHTIAFGTPVSMYKGQHREENCQDGGLSMSDTYKLMFQRMAWRLRFPYAATSRNYS